MEPMNRTFKMVSFAFLLGVLMVAGAQAATYTAATCAESDVSTALNKISSDGDIVAIPAGNCSWTTALNYAQTKSFTLQGAGAVTPSGGSDQTIIQDNFNYSGVGTGFINISTISGKSFRMTGIAFYWGTSQTSVTNNGEIQIGGYSQAVRIDDCHFYQPAGATNGIVLISIWNWIFGVADHNQFDLTSNDTNGIRVCHPNWNNDSAGVGDKSWADGPDFGTGNFFFLESNTFNWQGATSNPSTDFGATNDCSSGGRFVFRYNTVNGLWLTQMHEMENDYRGCRAAEVYMNTGTASTNPTVTQFTTFFGTRMGTSLVWGNTLTGFNAVVNGVNDRTNNGHSFSAPPAGWGYCGTTLGPSAWDDNSNSSGYPCLDQVGRGKGQLTSGYFPNKTNSITGTIAWPNNAPEPVYVWANTYNAPPGGSDHYFSSQDSNTILEKTEIITFSFPTTMKPPPSMAQPALARDFSRLDQQAAARSSLIGPPIRTLFTNARPPTRGLPTIRRILFPTPWFPAGRR